MRIALVGTVAAVLLCSTTLLFAQGPRGQRAGASGAGGGCQRSGATQSASMARAVSPAFRSSTRAARGSSGASTTPPATFSELRAAVLAMYDIDVDGKLGDSERRRFAQHLVQQGYSPAYVAAFLNRWTQREHFDTDGDGQISPAEMQAARQAQRDAQAATATGWKRRQYELRRQYDADGDGKLSTAEKLAMRRELAAGAASASD